MAYKKIEKDFVLSDSSINVYGYRLLTEGYMVEEFLKNPIGYYMHNKEDGVLLRWENVRIENDQVLGAPCINMAHPRAERTITEIADGFLNAASVGKLVFVDFELAENADDPAEPLLIVTRWYNRECSLVDNPANRNAMKVELCDTDGNEICLADLTDILKSKQDTMKNITMQVKPELLELLNLSDEATADDVLSGIRELHNGNKTLNAEKKQLQAAKAQAEKDLADERRTSLGDKVNKILDEGLSAGKYTKETRDKLVKAYAGKPAELADLVGSMQAYKPIADAIRQDAGSVAKDLVDKDWDEIDQANRLDELRQYPDLYKTKFKVKFGKEPKQ